MKSSHLTASERSTLGRPVAGYPGTAVMVGRFFLAFVAAVVVASMNPSSGLADTIQAGGYNDYGHLANAGPRCASTATINSFQFLMNKYPEIRKTNLIPGAGTDLASARGALHDGWKNKNGEQRAGVKPECGQAGFGKHRQFWWEAKAHWVDDFAPGEIALRGMVFTDGLDQPDPTKWVSGDKLVKGALTWDFLWKQISDGEDVEIAFADKNMDPRRTLHLPPFRARPGGDIALQKERWPLARLVCVSSAVSPRCRPHADLEPRLISPFTSCSTRSPRSERHPLHPGRFARQN